MQRVKIKISLQWKQFHGRVLMGAKMRMAREHLLLRNEEAGRGGCEWILFKMSRGGGCLRVVVTLPVPSITESDVSWNSEDEATLEL